MLLENDLKPMDIMTKAAFEYEIYECCVAFDCHEQELSGSSGGDVANAMLPVARVIADWL